MADTINVTKRRFAGNVMMAALCMLVALIPFQGYFNIYHHLSISIAQIVSTCLLVFSFLTIPKLKMRILLKNKLAVLVIVFWGLMALDAVIAIDRMAGIKYFLKWCSVIAVFFSVYLNVREFDDVRSVLKVFLWSAGAVSIISISIYIAAHDDLERVVKVFLNHPSIALVMEPDTLVHKLVEDRAELNWYYTLSDGSTRLRAFGTFECVLMLSGYLGLILSFIVFHCTSLFKNKQKIVNGIVYLFIVAALALTFTRSGYASFFIMIIVSAVLWFAKMKKDRKRIIIISILLATGVVAVLALPVKKGIMYRIYGTNGDIKGRIQYWGQGLKIMRARPLIGVGLANYEKGLSIYVNPSQKPWRAAHNQYIQMGAEMGSLGLLVYLLIISYGFYYSWEIYQKNNDSRLFAIGLGFLGMWLWVAFQNMFFDSIFDTKFGMMFWAMVALNARMYDFQNETSAQILPPGQ
jgi:hypothetical protein